MIHAGTEETGVEVTSMEIDYWADRYIGAKRFN
jgi:cell wall-associated NlpC family hydrolase